MYGKILHGSSFGGLVNYVNDSRKNATLVAASDGINLTNNQTITDSFVMHAGLSCRTKKPVAHFVLAFSPHDAPRINNAILGQLVNDYLQRMGYDDNQFVAFRHYDKEHPHVHVIMNRVNFKGKCTKDSHEKDKNVKVCKDLTKKFGLYIASGKEAVKGQRLRTMDAIRYQMMHAVKESLQVSGNWKDFENELAKLGISLRFRYNTTTNGIEGISFTIDKDKVGNRMRHDISFSGNNWMFHSRCPISVSDLAIPWLSFMNRRDPCMRMHVKNGMTHTMALRLVALMTYFQTLTASSHFKPRLR